MKTITLLVIFIAIAGASYPQIHREPATAAEGSIRLPGHLMPEMGCWFWDENQLKDDGYKDFIEAASTHSPFNILTTSFRIPEREITETHFHDQIGLASKYAMDKGILLVPDLDLRLARRAFQSRYPDELQEMLILKEVSLEGLDTVEAVVYSQDLNDHYTFRTTHYIPLKGSVQRVYSYNRSPEGIEPQSLKDITKECLTGSVTSDSIQILIPAHNNCVNGHACVLVSFTHLSPDVFAPHLASFQRELIQQYADIPLAGACKDEWGFPPCFHHPENEFWYSKYRAQAYKERTGGRDLLEDCLLMYLGIKGRERERQMAINHFRMMSWQRNSELEDDFYRTVKEVFGPHAIVATHPTWYPYPGFREYKKNGLDWWAATRDWAQTDETTPFAVRTALAKKWGSPVWYNMYYSEKPEDYARSVWSSVLGGGRINYHPVYPYNGSYQDMHLEIFKGDLMQSECRVRLLNYISHSPLDCPVAVIFGHACTMNRAGPAYDDVGMELADSLWRAGIPADLIPSSEIEHLHIDEEGWVTYGKQRYTAAVLYHPEFENNSTAEFFNRASEGQTRLFRMGDWSRDFNGNPFNGNEALPASMTALSEIHSIMSEIRTVIKERGIPLQTPATDLLEGFTYISSSPPASGFCRLIDGTVIQVAGSEKVTGDPIRSEITIHNHNVIFDAEGIAAVRLDLEGHVLALAAGGLKTFQTDNLEIRLDERADLAMWINQNGKWEGVLQGWEGDIPHQLLELTDNWSVLSLPLTYTER